MQPEDDSALVRQYAESRSDEAFAELVSRHINLVYSVALRQVGDPSKAEDIAQAVFIILAKKAASLRHEKALGSWLFQTTRLTANNFIRSEMRRQRREQEAFMQSTQNETVDAIWRQIGPVLDDAVATLGDKDRRAILLRFYEGRNLREVGAVLGVSEGASEKRVTRALEKLRKFFFSRGLPSATAAITGSISANSVQAAPVGLAKTISAVALAKGVTASASTLTLVHGALKVMAWSKTKTTVVGVAVALLLGIGTTTITVNALLPVPDIQGTWECTLAIQGGYGIHKGELPKKRFVLRITKTNGGYQASLDDIDGAYQGVKFNTFTYKYPSVHGEIMPDEAIPEDVSCAGKVNRSGEKMSWKVLEGTNAFAMVWTPTTNPPPFPEPLSEAEFAPRAGSDLQGFWAGQIGRGKHGTRIQIKIAEASDGTFRADFYCLGQGTNLPPNTLRQPTAVSYDGTTVRLTTMAGFGMFEGRLTNGISEMAGNWIQGGHYTPTTLTQANYSLYKSVSEK